jgi:hypothetical protein
MPLYHIYVCFPPDAEVDEKSLSVVDMIKHLRGNMPYVNIHQSKEQPNDLALVDLSPVDFNE